MNPLSRITVACLTLLVAMASPASAAGGVWVWPLNNSQQVGRVFEPPDSVYSAGHRGVDLPGETGDVVSAVAAGQVSYVGSIAGVGVVAVDHGGTRSTYQPVVASVQVGDVVTPGQRIGILVQRGSHCAARPCLHLGRKVSDSYADPLELLRGAGRVQLISPDGDPPKPLFAQSGKGALLRPVRGPVTSSFGPRVHPLTGVTKLHDGIDFGVPCGTAVRAAAPGVVTARFFNAGYGNRLIMKQPGGLQTAYNHLSRFSTSVGDRLRTADVIGYSGSTGYSTGCHLHFMVNIGGRDVNPADWF